MKLSTYMCLFFVDVSTENSEVIIPKQHEQIIQPNIKDNDIMEGTKKRKSK